MANGEKRNLNKTKTKTKEIDKKHVNYATRHVFCIKTNNKQSKTNNKFKKVSSFFFSFKSDPSTAGWSYFLFLLRSYTFVT